MASKIWDSAAWKEYKNLRIYDGSAWKDAAKGWLWNGSSWKQFYPEYPVNLTAPTISGSSTQGNVLTVTDGTWKGFQNNDKAFTYTSTAYQWLRNGSNISGATGNQYATVVADVGTAVSCRVTVSNGRGPTPSTTSNSITIQSALPGAPSNLLVTSSTITPGIFAASSSSAAVVPTITMGSNTSVTSSSATINWTSTNQSSWQVSGSFSASGTSQTSYTASTSASSNYSGTVTVRGAGTTTAQGSWTLPTNFSYYTYSTNIGSLSADSANRTFTLTGSSGDYYVVGVTAWNSSGRATISWTAGSNATSYDIYINGSLYQQGYTSTSLVYNWGSTGNLSVNVRSRNSQGAEATGVTASGTINQAGLTAQASGYINSGNTASGSYSVSTPAAAVIPTFTSAATVATPTSNGGTLSWASTNQSSYSISAPGTSLDGQTGFTATSRLFTGGTPGTTYSFTVTITSSTGHTATSSGSFTTTGGGVPPGTPTGATVTGSGYVSWGASTGAVATYEILFYTATDTAGSNRGGPYYVLSIPGNQTYYQLTSSDGYASPNNYVRIQVRSRNSSGVSTYGTWDPSATTYR